MNQELKVLVLCANGAVTSTMVLNSLKEAFQERNLQAAFTQKRVVEGAQALKDTTFDVVISTAGQDFGEATDVPILSGIPFLTGVGQEEIIAQVMTIAAKKTD